MEKRKELEARKRVADFFFVLCSIMFIFGAGWALYENKFNMGIMFLIPAFYNLHMSNKFEEELKASPNADRRADWLKKTGKSDDGPEEPPRD